MKNDNSLHKPEPSLWNELNFHPSPTQLKQFKLFQTLLKSLNNQINLTRLLNGDDYWVLQVFDSLWPFKRELNEQELKLKLIDIGSGCGFPGLAIAIALPKSKVTLIEAIQKKKEALEFIIKELNLDSRVNVRNERAEETGQNILYRGRFDIAMARAVGLDSVVAEYLVPLIKKNGEAILFKGKLNKDDIKDLNNALKSLNAKIKTIESIQLPEQKGIRHQIRITPSGQCPKKYPRAIGIPKKRPLGK